jgi:flagellar hook-associated protein 1 FlgK
VITGDPTQILAAGTVPAAVGDGDRARLIGNLRDQAILTGNPVGSQSVKPGDYLQAIQSQIGMQVADATRSSEAAGLQVTQAEKLRQSVAGVSLDDEMTKMIQFQQAYNASARMMTSLDQMLDTLINRVGIVGR